MTEKPVLYHAPRTRSVRIIWLMQEMGLDHDIVPVKFDQRPAGDADYDKVHPLRKIPALRDNGQVVIESVAIMQYLLGRYGPSELEVRPDEDDYGRYLQWLHFGEAGMIMPVSMLLAHTALLPEDKRDANLAKWAKHESDKILAMLGEHAIGEREFVAGARFTAADISLTYMFYLLKLIRQFGEAPDNVKAYFKRMTERPSWEIASRAD
ncbi:glutathione S-transferase family protein [Maricaulis sp. CAU 1757]